MSSKVNSSVPKLKVKTFTCPTVRLPERVHRPRDDGQSNSSSSKKRSFDDSGDSSMRTKPAAQQLVSKKAKYGAVKSEMNDIMKEIKELSSTALLGSAKKKYKEDILTKLGAPPVKEQTMPFKMKMGILKGRKKREERALQELKESGVVTANKKKKEKRERRQLDRDDNGPDWNVQTFNGVLHLKNKSTR